MPQTQDLENLNLWLDLLLFKSSSKAIELDKNLENVRHRFSEHEPNDTANTNQTGIINETTDENSQTYISFRESTSLISPSHGRSGKNSPQERSCGSNFEFLNLSLAENYDSHSHESPMCLEESLIAEADLRNSSEKVSANLSKCLSVEIQ